MASTHTLPHKHVSMGPFHLACYLWIIYGLRIRGDMDSNILGWFAYLFFNLFFISRYSRDYLMALDIVMKWNLCWVEKVAGYAELAKSMSTPKLK